MSDARAAAPVTAPATADEAVDAAPAAFAAALEAAEAAPEAADAMPAATPDATPAAADAAPFAAPAPVAAALLIAELATPITSPPVVLVSSMVRPAPISSAGMGLARACSASDLTRDSPLSLTRVMTSPDSAEGAIPSRSWPSVSARPTRTLSASRCNWALEVMSGSP